MALKVRNKIWLGTIFLVCLLLLTGGAGIYYTATLKAEAKAVLQDNYESLAYCHAMQQNMDSLSSNFPAAITHFETALSSQENNITEPGEGPTTQTLRSLFTSLRSGDTSLTTLRAIRYELQKIIELNMNAISSKNDKAHITAEHALTVIITLVVVVFLIAFTFLVNFPSIITNPIIQLTGAITEISKKNYRHRIHLDNKDEFGDLAEAFNNMASRLEYFENSNLNRLLFEKSRAEAVINSLKDASIGIDKNNIILFANFQALQLLGMKSSDIVGQKVEDVGKINDLFSFLICNDATAPFKIVVGNRENYFIKETIEVAQGEGNSKVIVLRNITSFKELDVAKTNFIATISHELKTPLAASDFSLKLLQDERIGKLSPEQMELIENLKQDNQRILKIISELLNMSQVEAGKVQLYVETVNPYLIINSALENAAAAIKEKNITVIRQIGNDLPLIMADAEKTTWVLNNLLSNAIKYSKQGDAIELAATSGQDSIQISVTDHGPGIAPEHIPRIFERYYRIPGSQATGTGLGLAISHDFISAQHGRLWVASTVGKGSVFSFSLPLRPSPGASQPDASPL